VRVTPFAEYPGPQAITLRLAPIDVGFDLRVAKMAVEVPADAKRLHRRQST
jgi:hypothetical protein